MAAVRSAEPSSTTEPAIDRTLKAIVSGKSVESALIKAIDQIDAVIALIRASESAAVAQAYRDDGLALVGFAKQRVPAGQSVEIEIIVDPFALRRWEGGVLPPSHTRLIAQ